MGKPYVFETTDGAENRGGPRPIAWGYGSEEAKKKLGKNWVSPGVRNQRKHLLKMAQKIAERPSEIRERRGEVREGLRDERKTINTRRKGRAYATQKRLKGEVATAQSLP